jgi:hypothetical protein
MASFYHIFIRPKSGVTDDQVVEKMNLAIDWYKYSKDNWLVKSSSNAAKWQTRLKPLVEPDGSLVILKIDPSEKQGWTAKGFWDWYKNARSEV